MIDLQEFTYNFSKYRSSLKRFGVTPDEFIFILRQVQDDLDNIGHEAVKTDNI